MWEHACTCRGSLILMAFAQFHIRHVLGAKRRLTFEKTLVGVPRWQCDPREKHLRLYEIVAAFFPTLICGDDVASKIEEEFGKLYWSMDFLMGVSVNVIICIFLLKKYFLLYTKPLSFGSIQIEMFKHSSHNIIVHKPALL